MGDRHRILYVGPVHPGATARMREQILRHLGHDVETIDTSAPERKFVARVTNHLRWHLRIPADETGVNDSLDAADARAFDILWLDKALAVRPSTVVRLKQSNPRLLVVGYSLDDMSNPKNQSRLFRKSLPLYDIYFTSKTYNVAELLALGCPRVSFVGNAYDPAAHAPIELSSEDKAKFGCDVGFVGFWEKDRGRQVEYLVDQGMRVRVIGKDWGRAKARANLAIHHGEIYGDDYRKAICGAKINLGFLRKVNRDRQTTRSIEIPACGAFMLAERTAEHLALFEEGEEAEFFSSRQELLEKCLYYLAHDVKRRAIAAAGRQRCLTSGYSYVEQLKKAVTEVEAVASEKYGH